MKVRVTVVLEKQVETISGAVESIAAMRTALESLGAVKKWKEQVVSK